MTPAFLIGLVVALAVAWWVRRRAIRYRRDAESREARVLEALFVSRQAADGGASIDVDRIFGNEPVPAEPTAADAMLRAAGVQLDAAALLNKPSTGKPAAATASADVPLRRQAAAADRAAVPAPAAPAAAATEDIDEAALQAPAPVRDLVQVFFEARGFRAASADPAVQPIELVLAHKSDARRAYAFAPLAEPPSAAALQSIVERARDIGQKRVLIAVEGGATLSGEVELPLHGVRVLGRAAIEAQLARLDAAVAERIRAKAWQRAGQRLRAA